LNGQEKGTPCHRNGAARNRNGTNSLSLPDSSDRDATWSSELKTLAQSHFPPGLHPSMTYQPRDGTACGGAGGRIFAGVKLHARMPDICLVRRGCRTRRLARRNAIEPARAFGGEPGAGLALRNCESLKCFEIEGDNAERIVVETVCGCAPSSRSDSARPRTPATSERSCRSPKTASFCHIVAKTPLSGSGFGSRRTAIAPTLSRSLSSLAPTSGGW